MNFAIFQKTLIIELLWMTAPADSSFPTRLLFFDQTFLFSLSIINNSNYGSLFRKGIKMKLFYFLQRFIQGIPEKLDPEPGASTGGT